MLPSPLHWGLRYLRAVWPLRFTFSQTSQTCPTPTINIGSVILQLNSFIFSNLLIAVRLSTLILSPKSMVLWSRMLNLKLPECFSGLFRRLWMLMAIKNTAFLLLNEPFLYPEMWKWLTIARETEKGFITRRRTSVQAPWSYQSLVLHLFLFWEEVYCYLEGLCELPFVVLVCAGWMHTILHLYRRLGWITLILFLTSAAYWVWKQKTVQRHFKPTGIAIPFAN
jgi:hypothetical protein